MFDYLIVGCGFAGAVLAERIANVLNKRVLIIDRRNHIGGNAYDYYDDAGVLVHKYGPHYFRTNSKQVFDYLSGFTEWHYLYYRIKVMVDGRPVSLPINLDTVNELFGHNFNSDCLEDYFKNQKTNIDSIANSEDEIISKVGVELFEKIYKPYTIKQWGLEPKYLDASVCGRLPVRTNRDDRYFTEKYQAMPKHGYFKVFQRMLESPRISIMLQTDYRQIRDSLSFKRVIYTGPIDEFFDFRYGRLPYRSLRFEHETYYSAFYQPVSQINYPSDYDFTRVVEIKHVTGQSHPFTTIVREYPSADGEPFYPILNPANNELYDKYRQEAQGMGTHTFIGRLAQYKYMNMDQAIDKALKAFEKLRNEM